MQRGEWELAQALICSQLWALVEPLSGTVTPVNVTTDILYTVWEFAVQVFQHNKLRIFKDI